MRVFDSQPKESNSDTWGTMETFKTFYRECYDESVQAKLVFKEGHCLCHRYKALAGIVCMPRF